MLIDFTCNNCGAAAKKERGAYNRATKRGYRNFCSRKCAGEAKKIDRCPNERKERKRIYDAEYRSKNKELLKKKKAEWRRKTYDPERAAQERKSKMAAHVEYCRRPEYKKYKKKYDKEYRARKKYGEYWESFCLLMDIKEEVLKKSNRYQVDLENNKLNKKLRRRRDYERLNCN